MRIVVLNGSPREVGNTSRLVKAFARGAEEAGHVVDIVSVALMDIGGCLGCECCQVGGAGSCVQHDDMQQVYDRLQDADMVVLASPIYHFALSGQLQCVINRTYALGRLEHVQKTALVLSAGGGERMFAPAMEQYRSLVWWWHAEDLGVFTVSGMHRNHDLDNTPQEALDELHALGRGLR